MPATQNLRNNDRGQASYMHEFSNLKKKSWGGIVLKQGFDFKAFSILEVQLSSSKNFMITCKSISITGSVLMVEKVKIICWNR